MKIAFDLDGTLIPTPGSPTPVERLAIFSRVISRERVRAGTPHLLRWLRKRGHKVWIYTTSLRNPVQLRIWFGSFGVRLEGVVTDAHHRAVLVDGNISCSKYPPAFGIDLLVDDAEGVELEGKRLGFQVLRIHADDDNWCSQVVMTVIEFENACKLDHC
jgi:hypothetical protein